MRLLRSNKYAVKSSSTPQGLSSEDTKPSPTRFCGSIRAPSRRCATLCPARGLPALTGPRSSRVGLLRDGRHVVTVTRRRRSDKCLTMGAAGAGQACEAPTERREGLSCANAPAKWLSERPANRVEHRQPAVANLGPVLARRQGTAQGAVPQGSGLDADCAQGVARTYRRLPNDLASPLTWVGPTC